MAEAESDGENTMNNLTWEQLAFILFALRSLQNNLDTALLDPAMCDILTDDQGTLHAPSMEELDELCEELNMGTLE